KRYLRPDGSVVWATLTGSLVRGDDGQPRYLIAQIEDISARVQAQEALRRAKGDLERAHPAKSEFVATMRHKSRTHLNGLLGLTDLLAGTHLSPQQHEYVSPLQTSGEALLGLISDILDCSKIEAGQLILERQPFDLRQLVGEVVSLFAAQARGLR